MQASIGLENMHLFVFESFQLNLAYVISTGIFSFLRQQVAEIAWQLINAIRCEI